MEGNREETGDKRQEKRDIRHQTSDIRHQTSDKRKWFSRELRSGLFIRITEQENSQLETRNS
ncbi:hypothetical protein GGE08_001045 [Muricauda sp. ARW1Y1]|nr:hypothetical protein [Muricauda sp. ARW1Y1]